MYCIHSLPLRVLTLVGQSVLSPHTLGRTTRRSSAYNPIAQLGGFLDEAMMVMRELFYADEQRVCRVSRQVGTFAAAGTLRDGIIMSQKERRPRQGYTQWSVGQQCIGRQETREILQE